MEEKKLKTINPNSSKNLFPSLESRLHENILKLCYKTFARKFNEKKKSQFNKQVTKLTDTDN